MKRKHFLFVWMGGALVGVAVAVMAPITFVVSVAAAASGAVLYWFGRCHHGDRLGLLPPMAAADGTRLPARWYCDSCGRSWPAGFEHDRSPIVRFAGYDPTKLPAAARRAATLDRQRQSLAVRRAGPAMPRVETLPVASVTSISARRAAG